MGKLAATAITFPTPLTAGLASGNVVYLKVTSSTPEKEHCPGSASAPSAAAGYLCVYTGKEIVKGAVFKEIQNTEGTKGGSAQGALVVFEFTGVAENSLEEFGTWAVKAA
jgi:hypothetical protein